MATANKAAFGTTIACGATTIGEVRKIQVGMKAATIDVTNHQSTGRAMEVLAGIIDGGSVTLGGNWLGQTNTGQGFATAGLGHSLVDGSLDSYTITFTDAGATTCAFSAIVTDYSVTADYSGNLQFSATLKLSGLPTWGAGS